MDGKGWVGMNRWGRVDGMNGWDGWMGTGRWVLGGDGLMGIDEQGGADGDGWIGRGRWEWIGVDEKGWGQMGIG